MHNPILVRPFFPWFIGASAQANRAVASLVVQALKDVGMPCALLDEEECASGLWPEVHVSPAPSRENVRRLTVLCSLFAAAETTAVVSCHSLEDSLRRETRKALGEYVEIHVKVSDAQLEAGTFEDPSEPDVSVNAGERSFKECAQQVLTWLNDMGYLSPVSDDGYTSEEQSVVLKRLEELGYI